MHALVNVKRITNSNNRLLVHLLRLDVHLLSWHHYWLDMNHLRLCVLRLYMHTAEILSRHSTVAEGDMGLNHWSLDYFSFEDNFSGFLAIVPNFNLFFVF